jgi:hypothetical protein
MQTTSRAVRACAVPETALRHSARCDGVTNQQYLLFGSTLTPQYGIGAMDGEDRGDTRQVISYAVGGTQTHRISAWVAIRQSFRRYVGGVGFAKPRWDRIWQWKGVYRRELETADVGGLGMWES